MYEDTSGNKVSEGKGKENLGIFLQLNIIFGYFSRQGNIISLLTAFLRIKFPLSHIGVMVMIDSTMAAKDRIRYCSFSGEDT
jgi:hypothetical protein